MKKIFLQQLSLLLVLLMGSSAVFAQSNLAVLGSRFIVKTPASIVGTKSFTNAFDGTASWGAPLPIVKNDTIIKVLSGADSLGCTTITPNAAYAGKWVLIFRGTCLFSDKAWNVQQAGGKGIIIVNNVPGADPIGMAQGSHVGGINIPVLMISNPDGLAIDAQLSAGQVVTIGLAQWGFGYSHDLAIVPNSMPIFHAGAIPGSQLGTNVSPIAWYNMYTGGFVANIGNNTEKNISLELDINYAPGGNNPALVYHDSVNFATLTTSDSILGSFSSRIYKPTASSTGRYDFVYSIKMDSVDSDPFDNTATFSTYVTDSVFCKSRWNNVTGRPYTNGSTRFANTSLPLVWGPLFYINNTDYRFEKVQFGVNDGDTSKHSLDGKAQVFCYLYQWVDGSNGGAKDSIIQNGEINLIGAASRAFSSLDTNDISITAPWTDLSGIVGNNVYARSVGWYWVAIDVSTNYSLDLDINANYFGRLNAAKANGIREFATPNYSGGAGDAIQSSSTALLPIAFTNTVDLDSVGINTFKDLTPSVALHLSKIKYPVSVPNVTANKSHFTIYPNPATENLNVKLDLTQVSNKVVFNIADVRGRSVYRETKNNLKSESLSFPISNLPAGQYYMSVYTDEGLMNLPFTVVGK